MIIEEKDFKNHQMSKLLKGTVVPRPIAWVSSVSAEGISNLAPFSYFTVISSDPMMLGFSIGNRPVQDKDTLANIKDTGEFVVNMVSAKLAEGMHISSKGFPAEVSEFEKAGVTELPGHAVDSPRVKESPISMECKLDRIIVIGGSSLVIGKVVCYHILDELYMENDKVDIKAFDPIGRLAGDYAYIREFFDPRT